MCINPCTYVSSVLSIKSVCVSIHLLPSLVSCQSCLSIYPSTSASPVLLVRPICELLHLLLLFPFLSALSVCLSVYQSMDYCVSFLFGPFRICFVPFSGAERLCFNHAPFHSTPTKAVKSKYATFSFATISSSSITSSSFSSFSS